MSTAKQKLKGSKVRENNHVCLLGNSQYMLSAKACFCWMSRSYYICMLQCIETRSDGQPYSDTSPYEIIEYPLVKPCEYFDPECILAHLHRDILAQLNQTLPNFLFRIKHLFFLPLFIALFLCFILRSLFSANLTKIIAIFQFKDT